MINEEKKKIFWILFAWNHYRVWRLVSFVSGVTITLHRSRGYCTKRIVSRLLWHRIPIQHQNKRVRERTCRIYRKSSRYYHNAVNCNGNSQLCFTIHKYLLLFYGMMAHSIRLTEKTSYIHWALQRHKRATRIEHWYILTRIKFEIFSASI